MAPVNAAAPAASAIRLLIDQVEDHAAGTRLLRLLYKADAQADYDRQRQEDGRLVSDQQRQEIASLAADFPRLWNDPHVPQRERKRMVRLLIEDVTLLRADEIVAHVRFRGGATRSLHLPLPLPAPLLRKTHPDVVAEVDRLIDEHTDSEIASILNGRGIRPALGDEFTSVNVHHLRYAYGLRSRFMRLREKGMLTAVETAATLRIHPQTVRAHESRGLLVGHVYDDNGRRLYEPPPNLPQEVCQRCGIGLLTTWATPGRRRKWYSPACMYAAYRSRKRPLDEPVAVKPGEVSSIDRTHEVQSVA